MHAFDDQLHALEGRTPRQAAGQLDLDRGERLVRTQEVGQEGRRRAAVGLGVVGLSDGQRACQGQPHDEDADTDESSPGGRRGCGNGHRHASSEVDNARRMIRRRVSAMVLVVAWISAACGQGTATPSPSGMLDDRAFRAQPARSGSAPTAAPETTPGPEPSPPEPDRPSPAATGAAAATPAPPSLPAASPAATRPGPVVLTPGPSEPTANDAWGQVTAGIARDGTIPLEVALQAFALAIGPLPGVEVPSGDQPPLSSGSEPTRWLIGHWDELTPDQQAAAAAHLGLPTPEDVARQQDVASLVAVAPPPPACAAEATGPKVEELRAALDAVQPKIAEKLKRELGIPVVFELGNVEGRSGIAANTVPLDANCQPAQARPAYCQIQVTDRGQGLAVAMTHLVAHEVFHCFQYDFATSAKAAGKVPAWLAEGSAAWVGEDLSFGSTLGEEYWETWLKEPLKPLFEQTYGGIGFFMHLQESGIDPWPLLVKMHLKGESSSIDAYTVATKGKDAARMIDAWGPSFMRDVSLRPDWSTSGWGLPEYVKTPVYEEPLTKDSGGFILAAPPQAGVAAKFDVSADVVVLQGKTARGMVRLADGTQWNLQEVLGKPICLEGTCSCPSGSAGAAHEWLKGTKGIMLVGLSGHTDGADVIVEGFDVKTTCDFPPFEFQPEFPCWCPPGPLGSIDLIAMRSPSDVLREPAWRSSPAVRARRPRR